MRSAESNITYWFAIFLIQETKDLASPVKSHDKPEENPPETETRKLTEYEIFQNLQMKVSNCFFFIIIQSKFSPSHLHNVKKSDDTKIKLKIKTF